MLYNTFSQNNIALPMLRPITFNLLMF